MHRWFAAFIITLTSASALGKDLPQLDPDKTSACTTSPTGEQVQIQCDEASKRCLVAPVQVSIDDDRAPDMEVLARALPSCSPAAPGAWNRLVADGYDMVDARLPAPFGYKRDERNRLFQTHFYLRDRFYVGVGDTMSTNLGFDESLTHSVKLELGGSVETYDSREVRRHKFRFLEGSVLIAPLEIDALLFSYDRGRISKRPDLWITTFIGEPRRFDINLDIGPGFFLGRLWFGDVGDVDELTIDLAQGHLNWEFVQSKDLEDVLYLRAGGGLGLRKTEGVEQVGVYVYPEAALGGAIRIGTKGLWELGGEVRWRYAAEIDRGETFTEVRGALALERILIAVNDQPISAFVEPSVHFIDTGDRERQAAQVMVGGRLSFFVPPPPRAID